MADPIEDAYRKEMNDLARFLDKIFNGNKKGHDRTIGFTLLIFEFGNSKRLNYISNANRTDMLVAMKEFIVRNEGQPLTPGNA